MLKIKEKRAFTLVELLVVVLIIAILAAIAMPKYWSTAEKAKSTERLLLAQEIARAQQRYYLAQSGTYATSMDQLDQDYPQAVIDGLADKNIEVTPKNVNGAVEVSFPYPNEIFNYKIYVCLENRAEGSWQQSLVACSYDPSAGSVTNNRKACEALCGGRGFDLNFGGNPGCVISYMAVK